MLYTEQEAIQEAKAFIIALEYNKARQILVQYPNNVTAQLWLAKLDQVGSKDFAFPDDHLVADVAIPFTNPYFKLATPETNRMWNPINAFFLTFTLLFIPFAPLFIIWNWKRYGRTSWAVQTFLLGVGGIITIFTGLFMWVLIYNDWASPRGMSLPLTASIFFIAYWLGLGFIQNSIYTQEKKRGIVSIPSEHRQRFRRWAVWISIPATIVTVLISIGLFLTSFDKTFENDLLELTYSGPNWEEITPETVEYCSDEELIDCFFGLERDPSEDTWIIFLAIELPISVSAQQFDQIFWAQISTELEDDAVERSHHEIVIDGVTGTKREYSLGVGNSEYLMMITLRHGDYIIQIHTGSSDRVEYEDAQKHIMNVINSIEFKQPQS